MHMCARTQAANKSSYITIEPLQMKRYKINHTYTHMYTHLKKQSSPFWKKASLTRNRVFYRAHCVCEFEQSANYSKYVANYS